MTMIQSKSKAVTFLMSLCISSSLFFSINAQADNAQLTQLLDADWQWSLKNNPENATLVGDNRYNNKLSDTTLAASIRANKHDQDMLAAALKIKPETLSPQEAISYAIFIQQKQQLVDAAKMYPYIVQPISQIDGLQTSLPSLVVQTPFNNAMDYHNYLARLYAIPAYVDGIIAQLQQGIKSGWVAPKVIIAPVPRQLRELRLHLAESEFAKPFAHIPKNVPRPAVFVERGNQALNDKVAPALLKLENFINTTYLPACRDTISAGNLPAGAAYYNFMVKNSTTTSLTPQQIHEIGLSEVARIRAQMQQVMNQVGFKGSFNEFSHFLNTDPQFFYTNEDDLLNGFRDIINKVYVVLPTLFARLPKVKADVKPVPALGAEEQPAAYYSPGPDDGSRAGYFAANTSKLNTRPKWGMETLTLHEAIPGHHLQISMAQEQKSLPKFRRNGWFNAFGEGWALYSESLGDEIGLYKDPYSKFGNLNDELFRAARLVVDTGIHALGWSREQAIAYLNQNTANPESDNIVEIDRYIAWPGQALGYKIGQLKIRELRQKAQLALGDKFDLRGFHNAVIDNGAMPLSVLETQIDAWIETQKQH